MQAGSDGRLGLRCGRVDRHGVSLGVSMTAALSSEPCAESRASSIRVLVYEMRVAYSIGCRMRFNTVAPMTVGCGGNLHSRLAWRIAGLR